MTFQDSIKTCLAKYAVFSGRARRPEFWWFYLFGILAHIAANIVGGDVGHAGAEALSGLVGLALFLPSLSAGARRLHDTGKSGWWQLLIISIIGILVLIYWWVQPSQDGSNKYGPEAAM